MKLTDQIVKFASQHQGTFRRIDVINALAISREEEAKLSVQLNRLTMDGRLSRVGYGKYSLPLNKKPIFTYQPSEREIKLSKLITEKFPFTDFCIWRPSALTPFMQHIPASNIIFIDVERVAMEAVFSYVQANNIGMSVLLNPSKTECERYITTDDLIIIRALINEAPCTVSEGCSVPTIEKMLVDALVDKELTFMQGSELYTIFRNVYETQDINQSRLLRYASRRNRKELVYKILKAENL